MKFKLHEGMDEASMKTKKNINTRLCLVDFKNGRDLSLRINKWHEARVGYWMELQAQAAA